MKKIKFLIAALFLVMGTAVFAGTIHTRCGEVEVCGNASDYSQADIALLEAQVCDPPTFTVAPEG